jgi:hypothetical protein
MNQRREEWGARKIKTRVKINVNPKYKSKIKTKFRNKFKRKSTGKKIACATNDNGSGWLVTGCLFPPLRRVPKICGRIFRDRGRAGVR